MATIYNKNYIISTLLMFVYLLSSISFTVQSPTNALKDNIPKGSLSKEDTLRLKTSKFVIIRSRMDWIQSHAACEAYCSSLAYFEDVDAVKSASLEIKRLMDPYGSLPADYFVAEKKYEYGMDRRYWIGLNDLDTEGIWKWTGQNRTLNYNFWYRNQPDHNANDVKGKYNTVGEHCVTLWFPSFFYNNSEFHTFNDEPCGNKYYAICNTPRTSRPGEKCIGVNA